jgi:hypothetical protein
MLMARKTGIYFLIKKAIDKSNCGGRTVKIAVFSDAHGNLKALKTTLEQIKEKRDLARKLCD